MGNKICVYTCITGNYDNLNELKNPEKNIDYYCFTNNKNLSSKTWKVVQIKNGGLDNCRLARKIKILGHPVLDKYDIAVWSDADVVWQKPISDFVKTYLKDSCFSIFRHHARKTIYDEAIVCLRLNKEDKQTIVKTLNFYKSVDYPDDNGLCESTVFIKKLHNPKVIKTMDVWFDMVKNYSRRDQLSFNYAVWKTNLKVSYISLNVWENEWFSTTKHNQTGEINDCHVYYGNPDKDFDLNKYFVYKYTKDGNIYRFTSVIPNDTKEVEFVPTNLIGARFENFSISPHPASLVFFGFALSTFCNNHGTIRALGDFKKGQKLSFSIKISPSTSSEINKLIEYQWVENNALKNAVLNLEGRNRAIEEELKSIKASKSWKAINKMRRILHRR
ncbi:DUF616 domain-containing protein [Candidatus Saccharibacteria bacterium]|nr:DUF616 domain-containing protein [Candidatus Saccharibacteria bacterium]